MMTVLGAGAALVDLLAETDDSWVDAQGEGKGGMTLLDWSRMKAMLTGLALSGTVPGGSACNTIRGLSRLGGSGAFLSKVGQDELGDLFRKSLSDSKVESRLIVSGTPTGRVLSAVTPDAERSMYTFLGASAEVVPGDLNSQTFQGIGMVYIEGYLAYNAPWFQAILAEARTQGIKIAFDFGSFNVVDHCRSVLEAMFGAGPIGILIANEDEAKAYTGLEGEEALKKLMPLAEIAVVKLGKDGALIAKDGKIHRVPAFLVKAIDTTGAGDLWASGFLFGVLKGWSPEKSGMLASRVASEVVQVMGPIIPAEGWTRILSSSEYKA